MRTCLLLLVWAIAFISNASAALIIRYKMDAASGNQLETSGVSPVADAYPQGALHLYSTEAVPGGTYGLIQLSSGAIPKSAGFTNPNGEWVASTTPPTLTPPARVSALLNNFTAMAWIKPSTTTGIHRVFSSQTGGANACWGFGINGLRMRFTDYGQYDTDSPNAPIVANVWQHLAVVKSSTAGVQFYVNGALSYSDATRTANLIQTPDALTQWRLLNGPGGENFLGNVAEIRLYDTALNAQEIITAASVVPPAPTGVLSNDFNYLTNPAMNFSHGTKVDATSAALTLFANSQGRTASRPADRIGNATDDLWVGRATTTVGSVAFPATGGVLTDWPGNAIFHAWSGGRTGFLTSRLTLTASGFYDLTASWKSYTQPGAKAQVAVVKNGAILYSGGIDGFLGSNLSAAAPTGPERAAAFALRGTSFAAGDTIDLITSPDVLSTAGNLAVDFRVVPVSGPPVATASIVISEFVATNQASLADEDGQFGDWIEIYNGTGAPVDLTGWALTDSAANLQKWVFPPRTLAHGEYLVVFADNNDDIKRPAYAVTSHLHTNFQLDGDGEFLALVNPSGVVVDSTTFASQLPDLAYGRSATTGPDIGYMTPTPGKVNGTSTTAVPSPLTFSVPSGRFTSGSPISVAIQANAVPGQTIRYTVNNTEPTETSTLYSAPLNISATTVVRARAYVNGLKGLLSEATYLFVANGTQPDAATSYTLPIMVIDMLGTGAITTAERGAMVAVFEPDATGKTSLANAPTIINRASMHVRGQSSAGYKKQGFDLEFWNETNNDRRVPLLGLPANGDWALYAPYEFDRVYFNNRLTYEMAARMGRYAPRTRFVELYVNPSGGPLSASHYYGIYVLAETVEVDRDRVDITEMLPTDNAGEAVTGGYIVSINKSDEAETVLAASLPFMRHMRQSRADITLTGGMTTFLEYPRGPVVTNQQKTYIDSYLAQTEAAIYGSGFKNPATGLHYTEYLGRDTFIDYHIAQTVPQNIDALRLSTYFYKDRGDKLKAGPIWDADRALGSRDSRNSNPAVWDTQTSTDKTEYFHYGWWHRLFQDPDFMQLWVDRYAELRSVGGALNSAGSVIPLIDQFVAEVAPAGSTANAMTRDYGRWFQGAAGTGADLSGARQPYATEVSAVKTWLQNRFNFMDGQILPMPLIASAPEGNGMKVTFSISTPTANDQIFFTTDGTDPRAPGGTISPAAVLTTSGSSVTLTSTTVLHVRRRNNSVPAFNSDLTTTKMSQWSGLTSVTIPVGAPFAVPGDITVSALHYHPANPNQAERDAGFLTDTPFEFIELINIANHPVTLAGASFTAGIDNFSFPGTLLAQLAPGERVLVVNNLAAFSLRYDAAAQARVIGEYGAADALDNGGETITLLAANGVDVLLSFSYEDDGLWPVAADGTGPALVLRAPESNPSLGSARNWRPSVESGGSPGTTDRLTFAAWKTAHGISSDTDDRDGDGVSAALEYSLGTSPDENSQAGLPKMIRRPNGALAIQFQRDLSADDAAWQLWTSTQLPNWQAATANVVSRTFAGDIETITIAAPTGIGAPQLFQVRFTLP